MAQLPLIADVAQAVQRAGLGIDPSELHGALCGWLCGGGENTPGWPARVLADDSLPAPEAEGALDELRQVSSGQLEDRGFGFITPSTGGPEVFVHISTFPKDGTRPRIGERLSFEIEQGEGGKKQAKRLVCLDRSVAGTVINLVAMEHVEVPSERHADTAIERLQFSVEGVRIALARVYLGQRL